MKKHQLFIFLVLLFIFGCNKQKINDDVIVIIQPKLEKETTNSIKILFKGLSENDSIFIDKVDGLEFNNNPGIQEVELNGEKYLEYYNYIIPHKIGEIELPSIQGISKDKIITATPKSIHVLEKLSNVTQNDIVLKLVSDKKKYNLKDTINIALYEYSKYYQLQRNTLTQDSILNLPKFGNKENAIHIEFNIDLYKLSGNEDLENYLFQNFEFVDFNFDPFRSGSIMEELNNSLYIKTLLFSFKLLPKHTGKFNIKPSEFIYSIYKSESDYYNLISTNEDGSHTFLPPKSKILVKSNELVFSVK